MMKVLILAGGLGSRLSEETVLKPKPMVEISGKPILWHIMKIYSHYGFNDFVILSGYKSHVIKDFFRKLLPTLFRYYGRYDYQHRYGAQNPPRALEGNPALYRPKHHDGRPH